MVREGGLIHKTKLFIVFVQIFANFDTCSHGKIFYHANFLSCVHRGYGDPYFYHIGENYFHENFPQYKGIAARTW